MSPEESKSFGCRDLEMAWKSKIFVMCFAFHCKSNMCDLNHWIVTSEMWEIVRGNVGQNQECRRCGDERVLKFKVNFERRSYSQIIVFLRSSIVHDVLINTSHPKGSEKYCLKMSAGLSCATSFQRSLPRLLTISPDLLRKFIYTWCFNQCQSFIHCQPFIHRQPFIFSLSVIQSSSQFFRGVG